MADAVEQALLLPEDMADLRSMRKHEVFLYLKRDLALVNSLIAPFRPFHFIFYFLFFFILILMLFYFYPHTYAFLFLYSYLYLFSLTFVLPFP